MNRIGVIIKKELARVFGDRKLVFSLFILPAVLMILIYSMIGFLSQRLSSDIEEHVPTVFVQNAPSDFTELVTATGFAEYANLNYLSSNESAANIDAIKADILNGTTELLVVFDPDFTETYNSYTNSGDRIPNITFFYNTTGNYSAVALSNFSNILIETYRTQLISQRIGDLTILNVFSTTKEVIVNEDKANGEFLSMMLPYFIMILLFSSAMGLCVDAIAGEKERGTMASLLITPIGRNELVIGKIAALSILATISAIVYSISMIISMPLMMNSISAGLLDSNIKFSAFQIISLILIMITLVYVYVGIICLLSVISRNAKEAQTYITPLYIVVVLAGILTMFQGNTSKPLYLFCIPLYGSALSIQNIMTNELAASQFGLSLLGNVVIGVIITLGISKAFSSEKIMFNA